MHFNYLFIIYAPVEVIYHFLIRKIKKIRNALLRIFEKY